MVKDSLSKNLQVITILPLIIGIVVCAIISVSLMFKEHLDWLNESRDNLIDNEMINLNRISESLSNSVQTFVETV